MNRTNPLDLAGRTILVTGGSSGIGRETAIVLSELGARVIVTGRRTDELEATQHAMAAGAHAIESFDLGNVEAIPEWVKTLGTRYGPFNGFVHAAGIRKTAPLRGLSLDALRDTFRVNVDSAVMLAKGFRQKGCRTASASAIFITSVAAVVGSPATAAYAASKGALIGLTKALASELAPEGIRVNAIAPGLVQSEMTDHIRKSLTDEQFAALVAQHPLGLGTTHDIACAAAYLLSDAARWMTGHTLVLDGGFSAQ